MSERQEFNREGRTVLLSARTYKEAEDSLHPRILVSDSPRGQSKSIAVGAEVLLSSVKAPWHDLTVEYQLLPPIEVLKIFPKQHTIVVNLNRRPLSMERFNNGRPRRLEMMAGDIWIGPLGSMTGMRWRDPLELLAISPSEALLARNAAEWCDPARVELIRHDRVRDPLIEQIAFALKADLAEGCPLGSLYGDALSSALAVHLLRRYAAHQPSAPEYKGSLGAQRLRLTIEYIEANLAANLRLNELAEHAGLSPSYFCTAFERSMGMPPHQWVLQRRIRRARDMLAKGRMGIVEIAAALGFADQSHFSRLFRRFTRCTPAAFARQMASRKVHIPSM